MSLLDRLEAAGDDAARRRVLACATAEELVQLSAELTYRAWMAESQAAVDAEREVFRQFERELTEAPDDAARAKVIRARGADFLAEWTWQYTATPTDWTRRYQDMIRSGDHSR